jgi:hypothetical protein
MTELTNDKTVATNTFTAGRQICEIVCLVAGEHVYNMTNIGLNIYSNMFYDPMKKEGRVTLARGDSST